MLDAWVAGSHVSTSHGRSQYYAQYGGSEAQYPGDQGIVKLYEIVKDLFMHKVRSVAAKLSKFTSFVPGSCHCKGYQQCQDKPGQKFQGYGEYTAIWKSSLLMFNLLMKLLATKPITTTRAVPHTLINGRQAPYRPLQHANACATREVT